MAGASDVALYAWGRVVLCTLLVADRLERWRPKTAEPQNRAVDLNEL